jgi:hypothetical protein
MRPSTLMVLRHLAQGTVPICQPCSRRAFSAVTRLLQNPEPLQSPEQPKVSGPPVVPREKTEKEKEAERFILKPLGRPIGFPKPPNPTDGVDNRGLGQRWSDYWTKEKHQERSEQL